MNKESVIGKILKYAAGFETEILFWSRNDSLTRFADNEISQNVNSSEFSADIKLMRDGRFFKFSINQFDEENLRNSIKRASAALKLQKKDPKLLPLPKKQPNVNSERLFDRETACFPPAWRADKVRKITSVSKKRKTLSYGILSNGFSEICLANSNGLFSTHKESSLNYTVTVKDGDGYGAAGGCANIGAVDFDGLNESAIRKARLSKNPVEIKPGRYTVILEEIAACDLLVFLGMYGFNGLSYAEKRSFVSEALGKKLFGDAINITDDAHSGPSAGMPFDFEGAPRQKVALVEKGVIKNVVTDRNVSRLTGLPNTGHSQPQPNAYGCIPINVVMGTGPKSLDEIIKGSDNAVLVTELHYTNCLKPKTVEMTGMTRNGTFLVKNGKITKGVKNMRFTLSAVDAFKNILEISDKVKTFGEYFGRFSSPALKIKDFNFSSGTEF